MYLLLLLMVICCSVSVYFTACNDTYPLHMLELTEWGNHITLSLSLLDQSAV